MKNISMAWNTMQHIKKNRKSICAEINLFVKKQVAEQNVVQINKGICLHMPT